jgi:hypothetical protein
MTLFFMAEWNRARCHAPGSTSSLLYVFGAVDVMGPGDGIGSGAGDGV